jgi:lysozyme
MKLFALSLLVLGCQSPGPEWVDESESALKQCPGSSVVKGVDVSYYQGSIDFQKVKASGRGFVITRVGDGTYVDPKFAGNWSGIKAAGMVRGTYQFFRAGDDALTQADIVLNHVGNLGDGDLAPALDIEVTDGQSNATIISKMKTWLEHIESKTGRVPMIYTSPGFWSSLGNPDFGHYILWVANWQVSCPTVPSGWSKYRFWQSADNGSVSGISGNVDLDEFDGDLAELKALASDPQPPAPSNPPKPSNPPAPSNPPKPSNPPAPSNPPKASPSPKPSTPNEPLPPDNPDAPPDPTPHAQKFPVGNGESGCNVGGNAPIPLVSIVFLLAVLLRRRPAPAGRLGLRP